MDERGSIEGYDTTRGHRAPITVSRVHPDAPTMPWGRQDISVYLVGAAVFFCLYALKPIWAGAAFDLGGGGLSGNMVFVGVLLACTLFAGVGASAAGLNARELPMVAGQAVARITRSGHAAYSDDGHFAAEPTIHVGDPGCWILKEGEL